MLALLVVRVHLAVSSGGVDDWLVGGHWYLRSETRPRRRQHARAAQLDERAGVQRVQYLYGREQFMSGAYLIGARTRTG